jgi:hypothetical protein
MLQWLLLVLKWQVLDLWMSETVGWALIRINPFFYTDI